MLLRREMCSSLIQTVDGGRQRLYLRDLLSRLRCGDHMLDVCFLMRHTMLSGGHGTGPSEADCSGDGASHGAGGGRR